MVQHHAEELSAQHAGGKPAHIAQARSSGHHGSIHALAHDIEAIVSRRRAERGNEGHHQNRGQTTVGAEGKENEPGQNVDRRICCAREEILPCNGPTRTKNTANKVSTRLDFALDSSIPWVIMGIPQSMTKTMSGSIPM